MEILLQFLDFEVNYLVNMVDADNVVNNVKEGKEDLVTFVKPLHLSLIEGQFTKLSQR